MKYYYDFSENIYYSEEKLTKESNCKKTLWDKRKLENHIINVKHFQAENKEIDVKWIIKSLYKKIAKLNQLEKEGA